MRNFDFSPLYRSSIGFDRMANLLDNLSRTEQAQPSYPPYNIELTGEDKYRITMAVAGFDSSEISIEVNQNLLRVSANKPNDAQEKTYLHQGIAARSFERKFQLADHVQVQSANYQNGLLHIDLQRIIPESMKPRSIPISVSASSPNLIHKNDAQAA
ncbi:MAG: Hsp20 family protein [Cellvibrio sp.]|nr:Hsp20 family protein [Cellvibrio sp.]